MEFFIPGLAVFLFAILITFFVSPHATPMIAAILAIVFLCYGVYDHYRMFVPEYRLSTWQNTYQQYLPHIMIGAIIIYAIVGMLAFFTGGAVPVPSMPNIPTTESATSSISSRVNTAVNSIKDTASNLMGSNTKKQNGLFASLGNSLGLNKKSGNLTRSQLETL
jgi:uncharacterized membrane protein